MRILVTGINGYIGKSLYNALKDKYQVSGINRQIVDLTNSSAVINYFLQADYFDVVIHCAAAGASNPRSEDWSIMDDNLKMYYNLLQNKNCFKRLIHFGSGAETYLYFTPYGYSKKVIAKSILNQDNFYNIKLFGMFDENELDTRFIKANIKRYIAKEPIYIHQDKVMDFFYMKDLIKVIEYYINEQKPPKEYDCVYETPYTLGVLAMIINNLDKHNVNVLFESPGLSEAYRSFHRDELSIEFIGLEQGIKNTYDKLK